MEMALRLFGVGPGDEVIVPAYTYTASASVVLHVGARVVFVDSQTDRTELDYDKLAAAITEKTKAVIPVDVGGLVCDYDKIYAAVASKQSLFRPANALQAALGHVAVMADAAHAFGAERGGKKTGALADFTSFSFHAVKNLTTAEGGALTWNLPFGNDVVTYDESSVVPHISGETWNEYLYRISQLYSLHGQNKDALAKTRLGSWEYDVIGPWYKCNMTDIMASIGLVQLDRYDGMLERRRELVSLYDNLLSGCDITVAKHSGKDWTCSYHLYMVRLNGKSREQANEVISAMGERGIACNVHYKPLPMMTAYKALGYDIKDFPNAYHLFENEVSLPLYSRMTDEDVEYVISNFVDIIRG